MALLKVVHSIGAKAFAFFSNHGAANSGHIVFVVSHEFVAHDVRILAVGHNIAHQGASFLFAIKFSIISGGLAGGFDNYHMALGFAITCL